MTQKRSNKTDIVIVSIIGALFIGAALIICIGQTFRHNEARKIVSAQATATSTEETLTELTVLTPTPCISETVTETIETTVEETEESVAEVSETTEASYTPVESEPAVTEPSVPPVNESESILTRSKGVNYNKNGNRETWYNLNMSGVVKIMRDRGFSEEEYPYWIREDGCKMLGDYIIVAANHDIYPRGTTVHTSLGEGLVCDTGSFIYTYPTGIDIAVNW